MPRRSKKPPTAKAEIPAKSEEKNKKEEKPVVETSVGEKETPKKKSRRRKGGNVQESNVASPAPVSTSPKKELKIDSSKGLVEKLKVSKTEGGELTEVDKQPGTIEKNVNLNQIEKKVEELDVNLAKIDAGIISTTTQPSFLENKEEEAIGESSKNKVVESGKSGNVQESEVVNLAPVSASPKKELKIDSSEDLVEKFKVIEIEVDIKKGVIKRNVNLSQKEEKKVENPDVNRTEIEAGIISIMTMSSFLQKKEEGALAESSKDEVVKSGRSGNVQESEVANPASVSTSPKNKLKINSSEDLVEKLKVNEIEVDKEKGIMKKIVNLNQKEEKKVENPDVNQTAIDAGIISTTIQPSFLENKEEEAVGESSKDEVVESGKSGNVQELEVVNSAPVATSPKKELKIDSSEDLVEKLKVNEIEVDKEEGIIKKNVNLSQKEEKKVENPDVNQTKIKAGIISIITQPSFLEKKEDEEALAENSKDEVVKSGRSGNVQESEVANPASVSTSPKKKLNINSSEDLVEKLKVNEIEVDKEKEIMKKIVNLSQKEEKKVENPDVNQTKIKAGIISIIAQPSFLEKKEEEEALAESSKDESDRSGNVQESEVANPASVSTSPKKELKIDSSQDLIEKLKVNEIEVDKEEGIIKEIVNLNQIEEKKTENSDVNLTKIKAGIISIIAQPSFLEKKEEEEALAESSKDGIVKSGRSRNVQESEVTKPASVSTSPKKELKIDSSQDLIEKLKVSQTKDDELTEVDKQAGIIKKIVNLNQKEKKEVEKPDVNQAEIDAGIISIKIHPSFLKDKMKEERAFAESSKNDVVESQKSENVQESNMPNPASVSTSSKEELKIDSSKDSVEKLKVSKSEGDELTAVDKQAGIIKKIVNLNQKEKKEVEKPDVNQAEIDAGIISIKIHPSFLKSKIKEEGTVAESSKNEAVESCRSGNVQESDMTKPAPVSTSAEIELKVDSSKNLVEKLKIGEIEGNELTEVDKKEGIIKEIVNLNQIEENKVENSAENPTKIKAGIISIMAQPSLLEKKEEEALAESSKDEVVKSGRSGNVQESDMTKPAPVSTSPEKELEMDSSKNSVEKIKVNKIEGDKLTQADKEEGVMKKNINLKEETKVEIPNVNQAEINAAIISTTAHPSFLEGKEKEEGAVAGSSKDEVIEKKTDEGETKEPKAKEPKTKETKAKNERLNVLNLQWPEYKPDYLW